MKKRYQTINGIPSNKRISNIDRVRKAYIMSGRAVVSELYHEYSSLSGEFDWVFKPVWKNWDEAAKHGIYYDIAGIDDTLRLSEYIRSYNPSFITQRVPPEGRSDLYELLEIVHLRSNDIFEFLCRTHGICGNDDLYVSRRPDIFVDVNDPHAPYAIPDFDTDCYGWLDSSGRPSGYKPATDKTMNCLQRT